MKNTDYVVYMTTTGGRTWKYLKDKIGWKQMGPEGQVHRMTAEQVLNHLLPSLANLKPLSVRISHRSTKKPGGRMQPHMTALTLRSTVVKR